MRKKKKKPTDFFKFFVFHKKIISKLFLNSPLTNVCSSSLSMKLEVHYIYIYI